MTALRKHRVTPQEEAGLDYPGRRIYGENGAFRTRLLPGETHVTGDPGETIVTVLGSCVSACIRDPRTGYGGMNHFMLPESETGIWGDGLSAAARYGNFAMEALINAVLKAGCARSNLEIKLFGGANFTNGPTMIGKKNSDFAIRYLANEGLRVTAADFGGIHGRRIHYHPASGQVARLFVGGTSEMQVVEEERRYGTALCKAPVDGDVQLFD